MSGGHYDYAYTKIDDFRFQMEETSPQRTALKQLLALVSDAVRQIEWVDSGDCTPHSEDKAIEAVFAFLEQED